MYEISNENAPSNKSQESFNLHDLLPPVFEIYACSLISRRRRMALLTVTAAVVE